jgi:flagellar protein FliO/FliZ
MRLIATLALGPSQRLVTVEVGSGDERRWLVLSVGPSGVTTLHTMAPSQDDEVTVQTAAVPMTGGAVVPVFAKLFAAQRAVAASSAPPRQDAA